jgi:serine/threonine-protein kinase
VIESASFGKYKLIAELGRGGMLDVYLALQEGPAGSDLRKLSVIKKLRHTLADEPEFVGMLVDEARINARINHPNLVQTNEVGIVDDIHYIAMEFLDGQPLQRIQKRSAQRAKKDGTPPPLTPDHQYLILMDAVAGIGHAHDLKDYDGTPLQIVHRDVTPKNIFVTYGGQIKVLDFGMAKAVGRASETRQGIVKGKVGYMAPEQAIGVAVTRQADLFAVGVILWEAAVGRSMWKDMDDLEILQSLVSGNLPQMPRELDPTVPEEIDRICRKALAVSVQDRYATAEELRADLEQYLNRNGTLVQLRRELGPIVAGLFEESRAKVRALIEKELGTAELQPEVQEETALLPMRPVPPPAAAPVAAAPVTPPPSAPSLAVGVASGSLQLPDGIAISDPLLEAPRTRRLVPAVIIGVSLLLAITGIILAFAALTDGSAAGGSKEVELRVTSKTPYAFARIDDQAAQVLPIDVHVPRDSATHRVVVEADGYQTRTASVTFDDDVQLTMDLAPADATLSGVPSAVSASPKTSNRPPPAPAPSRAPVIPPKKNGLKN